MCGLDFGCLVRLVPRNHMNAINWRSVRTTQPGPLLVLIGKRGQQMDLRQSLEGANTVP